MTRGKTRHGKRRAWSTLGTALLAAVTLLAAPAERATAATYTVESCTAARPATTGWVVSTAGAWTYFNDSCASVGGTFQAFFGNDQDHANGDRTTYVFSAPTDTSIAGVSASRSAQAGTYRAYGNPVSMFQVDGNIVEECQQFHGCSALADSPVDFSFNSAHYVLFGSFCTGAAGCPAGNTAYRLRNVHVALNDTFDPVITTAASGSLTSGAAGQPRVRNLTYSASDQGGGVYRHRLLVDGTEAFSGIVNSNGGKCGAPFGDPVPCRTGATNASIDFDTAALADGNHTVRLEVRDATDVNLVQTAPWTILVDNQPPTVSDVQVSGVAREGDTLTCTVTSSGQGPTTSYAWVRTNADGSGEQTISGASAATYALTGADIGRKVLCRASVTDGGGTTMGTSTVTSGPFAGGATVVSYCTGRPTGAQDECGDFDHDGLVNHVDTDDDNDGILDAADPAPFDASHGGTGPVTDLNTVALLHNPITQPGPNGQPPAPDALLAIRFIVGSGGSARSSTRVVAAYKQALKVRGTLQTPGGRPVVNAHVYLVEKPLGAPETRWRVGKTATTNGDGGFEIPVGAAGISRDVRVVYFPQGGSDVNRGSNALALRVRQDALLEVSRRLLHNGDRLGFRGRVLGTIPTGGVDVRVQVRLARSWLTFAKSTVTRAGGGRFRAGHRFTKTNRPTTYRFRVLVLPRNRTVFTTGYSRHIDVRVLP